MGKTSHAEAIADSSGLKHLRINKFAEEQGCYDGRDEELQSWIVDEDKVRSGVFIYSLYCMTWFVTDSKHSCSTLSNPLEYHLVATS